MAQSSHLWLFFQVCCQAASKRKAVKCEDGEEDFTFDDWSFAFYTVGDQPVEGITISGEKPWPPTTASSPASGNMA